MRPIGVAALALVFTVAGIPDRLIAYGRNLAQTLSLGDLPQILYAGEGANASVAVSEASNGHRNFHVSGKIEASTEPEDMRLQRMLGHLPALLHARPKSVLIVGFGAGVTAGTFVTHPTVERIVICEIEPLIPRVIGKYFAAQNENVLEDPRLQIVYDDARHYLLTTNEKFDVITSDPIHPWVKGAAALYTREYFELVRSHLNPEGVVSQWVPLYQSTAEVVKSELRTFFEVFRGGTVWSNNRGGIGFDIVLLGSRSEATMTRESLARRLSRRDHANVLKSLGVIEFASADAVMSTYLADHHRLRSWISDGQINRDRNLKLQYLAGIGVNRNEAVSLYQAIAAFRPPRKLNEAEFSAISRTLQEKPQRHVSVIVTQGDSEALQYAIQLRDAIRAGGWNIDDVQQEEFAIGAAGILIAVGSRPAPAAANELFQALSAAGLTVTGSVDESAEADSVVLIVGRQ
jgi:spermidine synthase